MQVIFVSNYINHHQLPFSKEMVEQIQGEYIFIQTEPMEQERVDMGWAVDVKAYPFVKCYYEEPKVCQELIDQGEIVIFGGVEEEHYIEKRLQENKITIRYSERIYKEGQWKFISPRGLVKKYHDHIRYRNKNVYLLCSGAYVASDFHLIHAYPDKMYAWGYFPAFHEYPVVELLDRKNSDDKLEILWAGRMIDWKHPDHALKAAAPVLKKNSKAHFTMAGGGELEEALRLEAEELGVDKQVTFTGFLPPERIRDYMLQADIFLFTSDFMEGWGAVLNEAMNSGCAVVAAASIGAVPYLLKHEKNGMVYRNEDVEELSGYVMRLSEDEAFRRMLGYQAYETIQGKWNAKVAATNMIRFIRGLKVGNPEIPADGPLCKAELITPGKGYDYTRR